MKKVIYLLIAFILMISLSSCRNDTMPDTSDEGSYVDSADESSYVDSTDESGYVDSTNEGSYVDFTDDCAIDYFTSTSEEEWLPDWQCYEDSSYDFKNVTPEMMKDYIEKLKSEGFKLLGGTWAKILYRDDVWIDIADNTVSYKRASVSIIVLSSSKGMSKDKAIAIIGTGGMSKPPCALINVTPKGFFDETGFTIFEALFDEPPYKNVVDPLFTIKTFIIGGGKAYETRGLIDIAQADIDNDGTVEAIALEYGPTSGVFSVVFRVFGTEDGEAVIKARSMYVLKYSRFALNVIDEKTFLVSHNKNYLLTIENSTVKIDDPNNELRF